MTQQTTASPQPTPHKSTHKKKRHRGLRRFIKFILFVVLACVVAVAGTRGYHIFMTRTGRQAPDVPDSATYPVRGIDVSYYQGNINWDIIAAQGITFTFIKATEGVDYVDTCFETNWQNARMAGLYVGAYHFYRFEDSGVEQAQAFIAAVPREENTLPPVIDIELYDTLEETPDSRAVRENLEAMITVLTDYYGVSPILYTGSNTYWRYVRYFSRDYAIWWNNYYYEPYVKWTFWQYTDSGQLEGYDGYQQCVDLDVYNGDMMAFREEFGLA